MVEKVQAVRDAPTPRNVSRVKVILGIVQFLSSLCFKCRRYIGTVTLSFEKKIQSGLGVKPRKTRLQKLRNHYAVVEF